MLNYSVAELRTYKKQSLFASGNGNKDYFFQLGIAVTDR